METHEKTCTIRLPASFLEDMRAIVRAHTRSLNEEILTALRDYVTRHKRARDVLDKSALYKPKTPNHCQRLGVACGGLKPGCCHIKCWISNLFHENTVTIRVSSHLRCPLDKSVAYRDMLDKSAFYEINRHSTYGRLQDGEWASHHRRRGDLKSYKHEGE